MRRLLVVLLTLVLAAGACGDDTVDRTTTTTGTTAAPAAVEDEVRQLVAVAEELRGLRFLEEPTITIVNTSELATRVRQQIEEDLDPTDLAVAQRLYEILGLLDGTVDLAKAYGDLYAEQVGGFYDNETGEMVVMGGPLLTPLTRSVVIHELVHALTDQHYSFAAALDELWEARRYEEAVAIQALAEGDATYHQLLYLQTLPLDQRVLAIQESMAVETSVLDSLPAWFAQDLTFPYDSGFGFVDRLVAEGGMVMVDEAYGLLPTTTEQILHPEKYLIGEPGLEVGLATPTISGYDIFEEGVFGEWNTMLFLLGGLDRGDAVLAAAGWGGDRYRIYREAGCEAGSACRIAFVYSYLGDTPRDAEELAAALARSAATSMKVGSARSPIDGVTRFSGGDDYAYLRLDGRSVFYVVADDPAFGQQLVTAFGR